MSRLSGLGGWFVEKETVPGLGRKTYTYTEEVCSMRDRMFAFILSRHGA